ncbi:MAG: hypothetical protein IPL53_01835 [Ignavibacteria bacterium]|nr:hypothetical protein [Ignavibacteria bacterium]
MKIIDRAIKFYRKNWKEITGGIISFSAIIVTVIQILSYRENEFRKNLFIEQFRIYEQLLEKASFITHFNRDTAENHLFQNALRDYEQFQSGKLMLVTDNTVRFKGKTFLSRAKNYYNYEIDKASLQNTLDSLSNSCRLSMQETFNVSLPDLSLSYSEDE